MTVKEKIGFTNNLHHVQNTNSVSLILQPNLESQKVHWKYLMCTEMAANLNGRSQKMMVANPSRHTWWRNLIQTLEFGYLLDERRILNWKCRAWSPAMNTNSVLKQLTKRVNQSLWKRCHPSLPRTHSVSSVRRDNTSSIWYLPEAVVLTVAVIAVIIITTEICSLNNRIGIPITCYMK